MKRREALKRTSAILGLAVSGSAINGILQGCTADTSADYIPVFFSNSELKLTGEIAERIIPGTKTPGARDVFVDRFIDRMLSDVYSQEKQEYFIKGLEEIKNESEAEYKKSFIECTDIQKDTLLRKKESEAFRILQVEKDPPRPFFLMLKELVLLGYFTSEKGAKGNLNYDPVPGEFTGCIPKPEGGKLHSGNHV